MRNKIMKKRIASIATAAVMSASCTIGTLSNGFAFLTGGVSMTAFAAESAVKFISTVGYGEGMYAMWSSVSGASGYNVYVDGTQIDSMLIRQYSGYMRADAVGLKAGSHTMKVVPVVGGKEDTSKAAETKANAYAHDRSGFGFVNGDSSGAYNKDGSLKSGATVVYVTNDNKDKVSVSLPDKKGAATTVTGIQNILTNLKSNSKAGPVCIRFIGNITDPAALMNGDLYVDTVTCGVTIEGIGADATFNGFGLSIKKSSNVEVRNLGFMNCNSSEGDDCSLPAGNDHIWVHNCDFFYGDAGSDADQAKGDGALDTKTSTYITHSYNHFWDNGKCNLQGMKSESTENYITYHHNWYDHSDSRHPRIRTCSVHCYNNYFDGNAKYGVGVTLGSSCFVENNYFRNCKYPMLSSMQGSDVGTGGTFSGEAGGVIKSYGNVMSGQKAYVTYQKDNTEFDAYEASSKTEKVPASVKTKSGGNSYNNFDTSAVMYSYTADKAEDVPAIVTAKAGRVDGGDFKWKFDNAVDDESYAVNTALKSALTSYKSSITAIGSGFKEDNAAAPSVTTTSQIVVTTAAPTSNTTVQTTAQNTTKTPAVTTQTPAVSGGYEHDFTANGTSSSFYTISGNLSTSKGTVSYGGKTLTQCLKMESATSIAFTSPSAGKITLVFAEPSATAKIDGTKYTADGKGVITADVSAGAHTITKADAVNLFYMNLAASGAPAQTTAKTTAQQGSSAQNTTQTTAQPVKPGNVTAGDIKMVSAGGWNEMMYVVLSGIKASDVTGVSYSGKSSGTFSGEDLKYLVRDTNSGVRIDAAGLQAGTYSMTLTTSKGNVTVSDISVNAQDRSGYAHFNYSEGVGAYKDNGELKANAIVLYVTDQNKNTVSVTSKDGTKVTGIGNILNSVGQDIGGGKTANGSTKCNTNSGIIKKLAEDGTPLVIRIVGKVTAPEGLTVYDSTDMGGSVGDNGFMARMKSGKDITIEGIGADASIDGWGFHFIAESSAPDFGKSFEIRNIAFRNVPEDCVGMEGVQEGSNLTAPVERCWVHNCEFYKPSISNPAESDKAGGDGACDFKRGMYFTNSYCYYEGYHKTNLVGASDSNLQFHLTYHHNYWNKCESRGPLARQANIHMYNNMFIGQTSYCMNPRANAYIFSEYNLFDGCKNPMEVKLGAVKSFHDTLTNCKGATDGTVVTDKSQKVNTDCQYANFDTNGSVSYIPSNDYFLQTDTSSLAAYFEQYGGTMDETGVVSGSISIGNASAPQTTQTSTNTSITSSEAAKTTTTTLPVADGLAGDANGDGIVNMGDAVLIMQSLANPSQFKINPANANKADVYQRGTGITNMDALSIQKYLLGLITELPEN